MERKTMDELRTMLCRELDEIAQKGTLSHESLDIVKDLTSSIKNLYRIEEYESSIDGMYIQRGPIYTRGNSYRGNSYGYSYDDGMSYGGNYRFYDPYMTFPMYARTGGYSRTEDKEKMLHQLKQMMNEASDEHIRSALSETIGKIESKM